jgi:hypothetical protein
VRLSSARRDGSPCPRVTVRSHLFSLSSHSRQTVLSMAPVVTPSESWARPPGRTLRQSQAPPQSRRVWTQGLDELQLRPGGSCRRHQAVMLGRIPTRIPHIDIAHTETAQFPPSRQKLASPGTCWIYKGDSQSPLPLDPMLFEYEVMN